MRAVLATGLSAVGALLVTASLAGAVWLANGILARQFDHALYERAAGLASLLEQRGERVELHFADELMPRYAAAERPEYFQLWLGTRELERSVSLALAGAELPHVEPSEAPVAGDLLLPDGRAGRLVARLFPVHHYAPDPVNGADPGPAEVLVVVGVERAELDAARRTLLLGALGIGFLALLLLYWLGRRSLEAGLRPLARLTGEIERIERQESSVEALARLALPRELVPVQTRIAALTQHLEQALERERRTSAHLAHELRTPVAELRAAVEVALQTPGDQAGAVQALSDARDIALSMQATIAALLALARARAGAPLPREAHDLGALVQPLWESYRAAAAARGLAWSMLAADTLPPVLLHVPSLQTVLGNLFDNAASHGDAGRSAECALEADAREARVLVRNGAHGLTASDLERLREPFWRADAAPSDRGHAGLGLALASECARAAGMALDFRLEGGVLSACLTIPRADLAPQ